MIFLVPALLAAAPQTPSSGGSDFVAETRAWHANREAKLKAEDGWLTLVGLEWLEPGASVAGSGEGVQLHVPPPAPARLGTFTRSGKSLAFQPAPGVAVTLNGKPFQGGALKTDADGEPDVLGVGPLHLFAIVRGDRIGLRMKDPNAPARKAFHGVPTFEPDPSWRIVAKWEPGQPGATIPIPNILGQVEDAPCPGTAVFTVNGKELRLRPILEDPSGPLFFIFGDETNKTETYGAGRFLYAELPKDGQVVLDFNRAVNPPCAFSNFATCPVPPAGNKLAVKIPAGEKRFGDH